jgi:WD40 repeat protein
MLLDLCNNEYRGGAIYPVAFSSDGELIAHGSDRGEVTVRRLAALLDFERGLLPDTGITALTFLPGDEQIVTGDRNGELWLWTVSPLGLEARIGQAGARVKSIVALPDGRRIVVAGDDQTIGVWDVGRGKLVSQIGSHTSPVLSLSISADGTRLASGEHDGTVRVYDHRRSLWGRDLE